MTACNSLYLLVIAWVFVGWSGQVYADIGGVPATASTTTTVPASTTAKTASHASSHHKKKKTTVAATATTNGTAGLTQKKSETTAAAPEGTPVADAATTSPITKKKKGHTRHTTAATGSSPSSAASGSITVDSPLNPSNVSNSTPAPPIIVTKTPGAVHSPITISAPPATTGAVPEVNTGLPVARHGSDVSGDSHGSTYQAASVFPVPTGLATAPVGAYNSHSHIKTPLDDFTFTNFTHHVRNVYPWKINIFTTKFWIGEGSTPISNTTNVESAWDEEWRSNNGGTDTPDDRRGYMPASHAARENPFYVALPFNDLAYPDKTRRWLPAGWYIPPKGGKQVSSCKDRWVEIKNAQGETCYAQWEDVGPLRYDHAEYVFGDERPDTYTSAGWDRAGLDVSPAVFDYLNLSGKNSITRWRFVDYADVVPGRWLQYDEEALIFRAMHELKEDPTHVLPIQRATAPIDDEEDLDSAKKKLGAAKG